MSANDLRDDEIVKLYGDGLSLRKVANRYGLSPERVRQILLDRGVEIRPRGTRSPAERRAIEQRHASRRGHAVTQHDDMTRTVMRDSLLVSRIVRARVAGQDIRAIARRYLLTPTVVENVLASVTSDQRGQLMRAKT